MISENAAGVALGWQPPELDDREALELIRQYFEEAELYAGAGLLRFVRKAGAGFVVVLANRDGGLDDALWDDDDDPCTMVEVSEAAVNAAERVLSALRADHAALRGVRICLAFDNPQAPDVFPGDYEPR